MSKDDIDRPLALALRLLAGEKITQQSWRSEFDITQRSAQRDVKTIRDTLDELEFPADFQVTGHDNPVYSIQNHGTFDERISLAVLKILEASRAFGLAELRTIMDRLLAGQDTPVKTRINQLIQNELISYTAVKHGKPLPDSIWTFGNWIADQTPLEYGYTNWSGITRQAIGVPTGLLFDTYYFYVIMHQPADDRHGERDAVHRLDRFDNPHPYNRRLPYPKTRMEESRIRQTNNLMQIGEMTPVEFEFTGIVEAVLDKYPSAKLKRDKTNDHPALIYIPAVNRTGFIMWVLSQGTWANVTAPVSLRQEVAERLKTMLSFYEN